MTPRTQTPAGEALAALLVAAGHVARDLDDACTEHGITHDQYNVLRILRGVHPAGYARGEIAAQMISRAPDVTRMLDRLVKRGLIERGWDEENRRLSIAAVTDDGLALLQTLDPLMERVHAQYTESLSQADLQALRRMCRAMVEGSTAPAGE